MATKEFQLDPNILGPNSAETIEVSAATDADVLEAIAANQPFPTRPNGKIELGHIALQAKGNNSVKFNAGEGTVNFGFSASFRTGAGVFDKPAGAINSLQLDAPPKFNLTIPGNEDNRYLLMLVGYQASGSFSASHPIGVLGTVTFGAQAASAAVYAVLHRFSSTVGAATALGDTISSWRLPRHVTEPDSLKPGTWILTEADGSVAIKLAAQLGYDFSFVRQANLLGITRELGAKIDAGVKATFGFSVSGRYIILFGRESDDQTVRLRLYKQSDKGFSFGLNVIVGLTAKADLPKNLDDFVQAVFGVHGLQVVKDLHLIEQWTDPTKDLSETVARLINSTGLDLLTRATGTDARQQFESARQKLLDALQKWDSLDSLDERLPAALWRILGRFDQAAIGNFKEVLGQLAEPDLEKRNEALVLALQQTMFGDTPEGQWLEALAEQGLLALSNQLDKVQQAAARSLDILNGGVIKNIQDFIAERLDLEKVRAAATKNDFDQLDGWLVKRLSDFLDQELKFSSLKEIQTAINTVIQKSSDIYDRALKALGNRYSLEFSASYQRNTTDTALLDVTFDLTNPEAVAALREVAAHSRLDDLLIREIPGVTLAQATLSHEIKRTSDVQIHMPFLDSKTQHVNDSLASLNVEHDAGRVLAYQLTATDTVNVKNRYMSQLSVLGALRVRDGQLELTSAGEQSIAYQSLQIKSGMTLSELEFRTKPFFRSMFPHIFTGDTSLNSFYLGLDQTVSNILHNPSNNYGDVALNLQVSLPAAVLTAWFKRRSDGELKSASMMMSRALQARLKRLIPFYFFQDLDKFAANESVAALLVWSAFPVSTSISFIGGEIKKFNADKDTFWDIANPDLRRAMVFDSHTTASLISIVHDAHDRLLADGRTNTAKFFEPGQVGKLQQLANNHLGDIFLQSLLTTEQEMVKGAASALKAIQGTLSNLATAPTKAIPRLADFGAKLTQTFNRHLSVYGNEAVRTLNSMLLAEASAAIDLSFATATPKAMVNLYVLHNGHEFQLKDFLSGELPSREEVAVGQTLTNLT